MHDTGMGILAVLAGKRRKEGDGAHLRASVGGAAHLQADLDNGAGSSRVELSELGHLLGGDVAHLGHLVGGPRFGGLLQLVEAHAVRLDVLRVVEVVVHHMLDDAQYEGHIGAAAQLHPHVGPLADGDAHGVHHNDLAAVLAQILQELGGVHRGGRHVRAPGHVQISVAILLGIDILLGAQGVGNGGYAGGLAHVRHQHGSPHAVQKAQHAAEEAAVNKTEGARKRVGYNGLGTLVGDDLLEAIGNDGHGLVPGDALELRAGALGAHALHGVENAILRVVVIKVGLALDARTAGRPRIVSIAADLHGRAIDDLCADAAGVVAVLRTHAMDDFALGRFPIILIAGRATLARF